MYIIYCATCVVTKKSYIGLTKDFDCRKSKHINDGVRSYNNRVYAFQQAIKKYGPDNFYWQIIEEYENIDMANQAESFFISYLGTLVPLGYNIKQGGDNHSHTQETRERISNTLKHKSWFVGLSGESHPNFGRIISQEEREKISKKLSGDNGPGKKINSKIARTIYQEYLSQENIFAPQLAEKYGLSKNAVRNILNKKSWVEATKDLPGVILTDRTKGKVWSKFKSKK